LGLARTAEVQRDARIGEADANMTTVIKEAIASEELMKSKLINDTEIARYLIVHILESLNLSIVEAALCAFYNVIIQFV
jgi:hypothetical protein